MGTRTLMVVPFYTNGLGWWEEWSEPVYDKRSATQFNDSLHIVKKFVSGGAIYVHLLVRHGRH